MTLMQFFRYLYHNVPDLASMWMSPDFLCALAATVFPFNIRPYSEMVRRSGQLAEKRRLVSCAPDRLTCLSRAVPGLCHCCQSSPHSPCALPESTAGCVSASCLQLFQAPCCCPGQAATVTCRSVRCWLCA